MHYVALVTTPEAVCDKLSLYHPFVFLLGVFLLPLQTGTVSTIALCWRNA